jgi:multidrug efflux system membrane fusion protein
MNIKITGSHILALIITVGIALWMKGGDIVVGGQTPEIEKPAIANRTESASEKAFKVSVTEINAISREQSISVRGRTKADAIIPIRAETGGILEKRLVDRGDAVSVGDLVCVIESGARTSNVESAKASLERAQAEYDANKKLAKKGFATENKMRQMLATLNASKAQLKQAEIELSRVEIKANASGIVQDPIASVGDVLQSGNACITLNDSDPMFFTGQVAEREIAFVKPGMTANILLVTGEQLTGKVSYIAPSADPATRTFSTEIELETGPKIIRDGLTATARINLPASKSYKISPSWISLADTGEVGVKLVGDDNKVTFKPITILSQTNKGFWVNGLEDGDRIITIGQEYVVSGEEVDPVLEELAQAEAAQ